MMNVNKVIEIFEQEFAPIRNKFEIIKVLEGHKLESDFIRKVKKPPENEDIIWHPGVYVFYGNGHVYRVGRHLTNSRMRVLQHINDNTRNNNYQINDLKNYKDTEIILFNVINKEDKHWVAAVEIYLEKELEPLIKSGRTG